MPKDLRLLMASAEHLKAGIKSHLDGDDTHFYAIAMQVAAHEAKLGHSSLFSYITTHSRTWMLCYPPKYKYQPLVLIIHSLNGNSEIGI